MDNIISTFKEKKLKLTPQRLAVYQLLKNTNEHPSAENIYKTLHESYPTMSLATVYKTLKTLVEIGVVKELQIENNEARYDIITDFHGHFKCQQCGKIYNFDIDINDTAFSGLNHFMIKQQDVYFKGICPDCL